MHKSVIIAGVVLLILLVLVWIQSSKQLKPKRHHRHNGDRHRDLAPKRVKTESTALPAAAFRDRKEVPIVLAKTSTASSRPVKAPGMPSQLGNQSSIVHDLITF